MANTCRFEEGRIRICAQSMDEILEYIKTNPPAQGRIYGIYDYKGEDDLPRITLGPFKRESICTVTIVQLEGVEIYFQFSSVFRPIYRDAAVKCRRQDRVLKFELSKAKIEDIVGFDIHFFKP